MPENKAGRITIDTNVNSTELAAVLGLTARRVQQMAQDGTITAVKRGQFPLAQSVQRYISFLNKDKAKDVGTEELEREKLEAEASIKQSKAIIEGLNAKELQGKMHRSEDVANMTEDLIYSIRHVLLALPGRLAVDVAQIDAPAQVSERIQQEVFSAMEELSRYEYDAEKYKERVRERMKWEHAEHNEDDED